MTYGEERAANYWVSFGDGKLEIGEEEIGKWKDESQLKETGKFTKDIIFATPFQLKCVWRVIS